MSCSARDPTPEGFLRRGACADQAVKVMTDVEKLAAACSQKYGDSPGGGMVDANAINGLLERRGSLLSRSSESGSLVRATSRSLTRGRSGHVPAPLQVQLRFVAVIQSSLQSAWDHCAPEQLRQKLARLQPSLPSWCKPANKSTSCGASRRSARRRKRIRMATSTGSSQTSVSAGELDGRWAVSEALASCIRQARSDESGRKWS